MTVTLVDGRCVPGTVFTAPREPVPLVLMAVQGAIAVPNLKKSALHCTEFSPLEGRPLL